MGDTEVNIKRIVAIGFTNEVMESMMKQASKLYGYGYGHIVHVNVQEDGAWALVADEYVNLGDVAIDMADDYYNNGINTTDYCVAEDGKLVNFKE